MEKTVKEINSTGDIPDSIARLRHAATWQHKSTGHPVDGTDSIPLTRYRFEFRDGIEFAPPCIIRSHSRSGSARMDGDFDSPHTALGRSPR